MKKRIIQVEIPSPKCFGKRNKDNKSCYSCIFLFDCIEKRLKGEKK